MKSIFFVLVFSASSAFAQVNQSWLRNLDVKSQQILLMMDESVIDAARNADPKEAAQAADDMKLQILTLAYLPDLTEPLNTGEAAVYAEAVRKNLETLKEKNSSFSYTISKDLQTPVETHCREQWDDMYCSAEIMTVTISSNKRSCSLTFNVAAHIHRALNDRGLAATYEADAPSMDGEILCDVAGAFLAYGDDSNLETALGVL